MSDLIVKDNALMNASYNLAKKKKKATMVCISKNKCKFAHSKIIV